MCGNEIDIVLSEDIAGISCEIPGGHSGPHFAGLSYVSKEGKGIHQVTDAVWQGAGTGRRLVLLQRGVKGYTLPAATPEAALRERGRVLADLGDVFQ